MTRHIAKEKWIFVFYILGFIVLAMSMALFQPLADTPPLFANPPDEHARYLIPKYICTHGTLPTGLEEEVRVPGYGISYGLYTVFPYIIQGYVMYFVNRFTASELILLYSARMVNVVFGILMALVVYRIGLKVFSDSRFRWLFCFAVMYMPQSLFLHTYVNTDSCCMLSTAIMIYALVSCYQDGMKYQNCLWMAVGIILCALSYYNAYGYIISCILLFLAYFLSVKNGKPAYDWRGMIKWGCFISMLVLLGIGWWFIRSYIVLDGDFLGLATIKKLKIQYAVESVNPLTTQTYQERGYSVWEMMKEHHTFIELLNSFIAMYGSMSICASLWLYRAYKMFFAAGLFGIISSLCIRVFSGRTSLSIHRTFFHVNMLFCILMPAVLTIYYAYTMDYQGQGRYLLPALIPFIYYIVKGIEKLAGLCLGRYSLPRWLVNAGLLFCFLMIIGGTLHMVYRCAMPIYLQTGMVLTNS